MYSPADLADLKADLRKTLGDQKKLKWSDVNLVQAIEHAFNEAAIALGAPIGYRTGTVPAGQDVIVIEPGLGVRSVALDL